MHTWYMRPMRILNITLAIALLALGCGDDNDNARVEPNENVDQDAGVEPNPEDAGVCDVVPVPNDPSSDLPAMQSPCYVP